MDLPLENKTTCKLLLKDVTYKDLLKAVEQQLGKSLDQYVYMMWKGKLAESSLYDVDDVAELKKKKTEYRDYDGNYEGEAKM